MTTAEDATLPFRLPKDWQATFVGDEFFVILGKMLDAEKNVGIPKPYLGNKSVQWGRIDTEDLSLIKLTPGDLRRYRLIEGDLLVCEGGDIGRSAIWRGQLGECYFQKALHRVRPRGGFSPVLLRYLLEYYSKTGFLLNFATQTSIAHLPKDKFEVLPLPKPPAAEQQAIAEALSDADALIEGLERLIAKKRLIKQGAMQELLTAKRRLPGFSGVWVETTLHKLLKAAPTYGINSAACQLGSGGYDYLRITDIDEHGRLRPDGRAEVLHPTAANYFLEPNDIVVARTGASTGKSHRYCGPSHRTVFAGFLIKLASAPDLVDPSYLFQFMQTEAYWSWIAENSARSGQPGINVQQLSGLRLTIPATIEEQQAIAEVLKDMDTEIQALETHLDKVRQVKEGMMHNLLTGQIRLV
ncbi:restriction endonuclease subunit S [Rhizobium leguminosarum]|uniref:restriction endonuclease subunit S n=1 Tax=Rhizobium leguminosarum TaxID=384 RepID=UPI001039F939|nr:restriction endonuclease subunit S [Rhizobium leguminosarum]TBY18812.1 restriction endonuclease subunit S [Rhizobium leguminosarum bv. viciae]TBY27032.1 restriction endonuclease subunit S [Rhizobium leguminosarum bv. viciae]TBZ02055.1 restriction endonuclease subunit S [Rhizobium leguminosarum bv. viciae]